MAIERVRVQVALTPHAGDIRRGPCVSGNAHDFSSGIVVGPG